MIWPFKVKKEPRTVAGEKLEQIEKILFPPLQLETDKDGNKFYIDSTVDMNLESVLSDLREGYNDATSQSTIEDVIKRLIKVRDILHVLSEFDTDAKYIIVDNYQESNAEKIIASD
jgi:hypothetical protein